MKVLVTGITGFTGRYVHAAFKNAGHEVSGLTSDLMNIAGIREELAVLQVDAIVHLAAIAFVGHGNADAFYQVNLIGTRNLLQAASETTPDLKSIMLVSSANVYGNRTEGMLSENSLLDPVNDYAVSKLAMEHMANLWQDKLPIFIVRPFNYTGVGQGGQFLIPKIVDHFRKKAEVIELGNLDVWREFGDVRHVADIYWQLIAINPIGDTINICNGERYCLREVISMCEEITGHRIKIEVNPDFVRANDVKTLTGDPEKLRQLLPEWHPMALKETLRWMLPDSSEIPHAD